MKTRSILHGTTALLSVMAVTVTGLSAHGQEAAQADERVIEEILVTATKRERSIQDIPVAVNAFNDQILQNSGVHDFRQLVNLAPSLYLSTSASETAGVVARIRGIGTTGDNPGLESAVGIFIDGVYRNRNNIGLSELGEIERVEVLRGPQGTLFGRNTSAGLLNVITKSPEYETTGYADATGGNFDHWRFAAGLSGPIVGNSLAARMDVVYNKRDGFLTDKVTGEKFNNRDRILLRGQLLYEPNDDVSLRIIGDWSDREESCCAATIIQPGPTVGIIEGLGGQVASGAKLRDDPFDRQPATTPGIGYDQIVDEWGVSAELNWSFDDVTLTNIVAYRDWEAARSQDIDFTSLDILKRTDRGFVQEFETFTEELRLNGVIGRLDWLVGFFFSDEDLTLDDAILTGPDYDDYIAGRRVGANVIPGVFQAINPALPTFSDIGANFDGVGVVQDLFQQNSESWALFSHNTFQLAEGLELTAGIRYTEERKTLDASLLANNPACLSLLNNPAFGPGGPLASASALYLGFGCLPFFNPLLDGQYSGKKKETEWSGTGKISYRWSPDVLTYFSYARGYKAGGFNLDRAGLDNPLTGASAEVEDLLFDPEFVDSFEIGAKTSFWDNRVNLNITAFLQDFSDFQLNTFNGVSFIVTNLSEVNSKGVEADFSISATPQLSFQGGLTFASTQYADDLVDGDGNPVSNLAGKQITNAPKLSISLASTYENEIPGWNGVNGFLHGDMRYTGDINTGSDLDIEKVQQQFIVVNARVGIRSDDRAWALEFWTRNLFDKDYIQIAFDTPLQDIPGAPDTGPGTTQTFSAFLAEPRTWGFTLRGRF